jgi:P27 family predicted phage terminase small subunit
MAMKSPKSLKETGKALWKSIIADYNFDDAASLELLERACQAADRAEQARESIEKNGGPIANDRFGVAQRHPAVNVERDAVATMVSCFKLLGLHKPPDAKAAGRQYGS